MLEGPRFLAPTKDVEQTGVDKASYPTCKSNIADVYVSMSSDKDLFVWNVGIL